MSSRYRKKHIKLPFCTKILNVALADQFDKVVEEFEELGAENANILNKTRKFEAKARGENNGITRLDIEKAFMEAFDLSQAAQSYMRVLTRIFGRHYALTFDDLFGKAIKKNQDRGYYENDFNIINWDDEK